MTEEVVTERSHHELPYSRVVTFKNVVYEDGYRLLRMNIREGRRFTIIDIDENSAKALGEDLLDWANSDSKS